MLGFWTVWARPKGGGAERNTADTALVIGPVVAIVTAAIVVASLTRGL